MILVGSTLMPDTARDQQIGVTDRDDPTHQRQIDQQPQTLRKQRYHERGDHFLTARLIEELSDQPAEQDTEGDRDQHGHQQRPGAIPAHVGHKDDRHLRRHRPDNDTEVQTHPGQDRNDQTQHQQGIA